MVLITDGIIITGHELPTNPNPVLAEQLNHTDSVGSTGGGGQTCPSKEERSLQSGILGDSGLVFISSWVRVYRKKPVVSI